MVESPRYAAKSNMIHLAMSDCIHNGGRIATTSIMEVANDTLKKWPLKGSKTPPCALNKEHRKGIGVG